LIVLASVGGIWLSACSEFRRMIEPALLTPHRLCNLTG
jgi:hypothetical protein